jgi:hypothetical protein
MEHADLSETIPTEKQGLRSYRGGRPKGVRNRRRDPGDAVMLRLPDASRRYGVSETKLKAWIRDGQIHSIKIGNIRLIEAASLNRLMGIS